MVLEYRCVCKDVIAQNGDEDIRSRSIEILKSMQVIGISCDYCEALL